MSGRIAGRGCVRRVRERPLCRLSSWEETKQTIVFVTHDIEEATYLATRVVMMLPRPGRVKGVIPVTLPHPRNRTDSAFVESRRKVAELLGGAQ